MKDQQTTPSSGHGAEPAPQPRLALILAYLSVFTIWGSTYLAIRIGVRDIAPALFAGIRFLAAGAILLLYGMITGRRMPHTAAHLRPLFVVGALLLVGGNGLVVWSEQWVPSGLAAVMVASVPLFMSSIDSIVPGGHRLPLAGWLGILIGFSGVVLLVYPTLGDWEHAEIEPIGIIGLVLASLFWSSGSVYSKRRSVGGDVLMNSAVQMLAGGVLLFLLGLFFGEFATSRFTLPAVLSLLYLIIFGSIIGFTSYVYLLHHVPPAKASTYAYVNPVVAILLGWLLLAESLELRTIIATAVILAGVAIVQTARTTRSGS